jgi:hypothetical protein
MQAASNTSLHEGRHAWALLCSGSSGIGFNESGAFVVDTIPPLVSISASAANGSLYASASSYDANPYSIEANVTDASGNLVTSASGNDSLYLEVPSLAAGTYTITAAAYDRAGNAGSSAYSITVEGNQAQEPGPGAENATLQNESTTEAAENGIQPTANQSNESAQQEPINQTMGEGNGNITQPTANQSNEGQEETGNTTQEQESQPSNASGPLQNGTNGSA